MQLLLATANLHKVREMTGLLAGVPDLEIISLASFPAVTLPEETGATMAENARLKALACADATGLPALADDSGIEVDALGGEPGVRSARWVAGSDADRMWALHHKLDGLPVAQRGARYRCAISIVGAGQLIEAEAVCEGIITTGRPRGANGFGYDPIFEITAATGTGVEWIGHTMAEAPPEVKARVSHRARAIALARAALLG